MKQHFALISCPWHKVNFMSFCSEVWGFNINILETPHHFQSPMEDLDRLHSRRTRIKFRLVIIYNHSQGFKFQQRLNKNWSPVSGFSYFSTNVSVSVMVLSASFKIAMLKWTLSNLLNLSSQSQQRLFIHELMFWRDPIDAHTGITAQGSKYSQTNLSGHIYKVHFLPWIN